MQAEPQWCVEKVEFYAILFLMIVLLLLAWILIGMQDVSPPLDVSHISITAR